MGRVIQRFRRRCGLNAPIAQRGRADALALADDGAFNFYYPDSIDLLERAGVGIVRFGHCADRALPDCQMIWLGGGYPGYTPRIWRQMRRC